MRKWAATLVVLMILTMALGIVMLASTSSVNGMEIHGDSLFFLKRQLAWMALALVLGVILSNFDYRWFQQGMLMSLIGGLSLLGLVLVLVPLIGYEVGGASRWINLRVVKVQPSEFAKVGMIIVLSGWLAGIRGHIREWVPGFIFPMLGLGLFSFLLLCEPDFGTTALVGMVSLLVMLVAGVRKLPLFSLALAGAGAFSVLVRLSDVRYRRIMAFLDPTSDENRAAAYQLLQSLAAIVRGGRTGVGMGRSIQKHLYLPEAHTDFIFAIIAEELGLIGPLVIIGAFAGIAVCGLVISMRAPDTFGRLLAFGLTMLLVLQAGLNIAVVSGCLPTKGIALPFVSYGGSSLLVSVACIALLVSIARATDQAEDAAGRDVGLGEGDN